MFGSRRNLGWLGIDWGTRTIKFAAVERSGKTYRIAKKAIVRRAVSMPDDMDQYPQWQCADFPIGLVKEGMYQFRGAACALPTYLADLRALELPEGDPFVRLTMATHELAEELNESVGERVLDVWDSVPTSGNRNGTQAFSMPSSLMLNVAEAIGGTGLDCEVIDGMPFAIGRAIELCIGPHETPQVAIDWGYCGATICTFRGTTPVYSRSIRGLGLHRLASAVGEALSISPLEAEELLVEVGIPGESMGSEVQALTVEVIGEMIQSLIEQVEKTLSYVDSEWPGTIGEHVWLMGGGAMIKNMPYYLSEKTGLHFRTWQLQDQAKTQMQSSDSMFAVAAALSVLKWEQ